MFIGFFSGLSRFQLIDHFVTDLIHISHDTVITVIEDLGIRILIHSNKDIGIHTCGVVYRAGNTEADVKLSLDHDTGLADLQFVRQDAAVKQRSGAADLTAKQFCQDAVPLQMFGIFQTVADTDDAVSIGNGAYLKVPGRMVPT